MGDIPLPKENLPKERNAKITTHVDERNPITIATRSIIPIPIKSTRGGAKSSSGEIFLSPRVLLFSNIVSKENETSTNRYKYIRNVQNSKVFYGDEIDNISNSYSLIGV